MTLYELENSKDHDIQKAIWSTLILSYIHLNLICKDIIFISILSSWFRWGLTHVEFSFKPIDIRVITNSRAFSASWSKNLDEVRWLTMGMSL